MKTILIALLMLSTIRVTAQSPIVIELFTSQGCSSCPAADKLVAKISDESKLKKEDIIVLSFHVDYWNRLGWKDPYSRAEFTERQRNYVRAMGLNSAYTPQAVVNGNEEFVGSNENLLRSTIAREQKLIRPKKQIQATAKLTNENQIVVNYSINKLESDEEVLILFVLDEVQTKIGKGENEGLLLKEKNVVTEISHSSSNSSKNILINPITPFQKANSHISLVIQNNKTLKISGGVETKIE